MEGELKRFEAVLLKCDEIYPSGRVYPWELMNKAAEEYNKKYNQLYVEAPGNDTETVDMTKIVGVVENIHLDGKEVKGTVVLLDTPEANIIKNYDIKVGLCGHGDIDFETNKVTSYEIDKAVVFPNRESAE